jgi:hypothetical protein
MQIITKNDLYAMPLEELYIKKDILLKKYFKSTENRLASNILFDLLDVIEQKQNLSFLEELETI